MLFAHDTTAALVLAADLVNSDLVNSDLVNSDELTDVAALDVFLAEHLVDVPYDEARKIVELNARSLYNFWA